MTPAELADLNRRMAEALGWRYEPPHGWPENIVMCWTDGKSWHPSTPAYTTDPTPTMPLMNQYIDSVETDLTEDGGIVRTVTLITGERGQDPDIQIAFCLAYLARHEARKGEG